MKVGSRNILTMWMVLAIGALNAQIDSTGVGLTELSLEQLYNVQIVSASKTLMEASQAPATVLVVTEEQIQIRGYRSLLDVLMDIPDIKIDDKVYSLNRNRPTLRGIDGQEKFIIMLDGMRISSPTNESVPIMENYPVNLARQIEIVYGPASALYGADAFSGIINIISKKAEHTSSSSEVLSVVGDNGLLNGSVYTSHNLGKDVILTLSGQYFYDRGIDLSKKNSGDKLWDMTSHQTGTFNTIYGPMTPSAPVSSRYSAPMMAYNLYAALDAGDFHFAFFRNYAENSSALENNPSNAVYNKDVFYGRGINSFSTRHSKTVNRITYNTSLVASEYKVNPYSNYRNMYSGMEPAYKYGYGSSIKVEEQIEWKLSSKTNLVAGAVFENFFSLPESADLQEPVNDSRSIDGILLNSPSYHRPEGIEAKFYALKYNNIGAYAQVQQKILKSAMVVAGIRYDHNSRFGSTINPRVGAVLNPSDKTTIKFMTGTAYLAPTTGSSYAYYGTFYTLDSGRTYQSNFFHLPNPKLKPMHLHNTELSVRQYVNKNFSITLTGYYTQLSNLLNFGSDNTQLYDGKFLGWNVDYIEVFINEGRQNVIGGSLMLDYNHRFGNSSVRAYSNISYVDGTETIMGDESMRGELDFISHWIIKSGIDINQKKFYVSPRLIWLGNQNLPGLEEGSTHRQEIPGYSLLNISIGYKVGKVTLFGNITNALNQSYKAVGPNMDINNSNTELFYGNDQDPIRFQGGLRVRF